MEDGLQISIEKVTVTKTGNAGRALKLQLRVHNGDTHARRIYLLPEPFRANFHDLDLLRVDGSFVGGYPPELHPHGIVVREEHFPEIAAGADLSFEQTLRVPADVAAGPYVVQWKMRNTIREWKGGVATLDGPTKSLFGGAEIPGIWTGTLTATAPVVLE